MRNEKIIYLLINIFLHMKKINILGIVLIICIIALVGFFAFTNHNQIGSSEKIIDVNALNEKGIVKLENQSKEESNGIFTSTK